MMSATIFFVLVTYHRRAADLQRALHHDSRRPSELNTDHRVLPLPEGLPALSNGYGASLAWIVFAIIFVITTLQFRLANRWVYEE